MFLDNSVFIEGLVIITTLWIIIGFGSRTNRWSSLAQGAVFSFFVTATSITLINTSNYSNAVEITFGFCVLGFLFGTTIFALFGNRKFFQYAVSSIKKSSLTYGSRATSIVISAFVGSIILTFIFWYKLHISGKDSFWFGFYQSWTAGFVAFLIFGIASIYASLQKPTNEPFKRRISNLYNTVDLAAVEYLSSQAQKVGYYAQSVERTYKVTGYDKERQAYNIMVTQRTVAHNFLHDASVPDTLRFAVSVEEKDKLNPTLPVMGRLVSVLIDGEQRETKSGKNLPIDISESNGIEEQWDIEIAAEIGTHIEMVHTCHYKSDTEHAWYPTRFTKSATILFEYCLPDDLPTLVVSADGVTREVKAAFGKAVPIGEIANCIPGTAAITFTIRAAS